MRVLGRRFRGVDAVGKIVIILPIRPIRYLDFILKGTGALRHRHLRDLHGLYRRLSPTLFVRVVERAHRYGVEDVRALNEIARLLARADAEFIPDAPFDESYEDREAYREGRMTDPPDLSGYEQLLENDEDG